MNKLQLPHAKLFYVVGEAYRKRLIDESEKRMLKGTLPPTQKRSSTIMSKFLKSSTRTTTRTPSSSSSSI